MGFAGVGAAIGVERRADQDVVEAVAVRVAGGGNAPPRFVARSALDPEPVGLGEVGEVEIGQAADPAVQDIGVAGIGAPDAAVRRADDEIVDTVAVDIARGGDAATGPVVRVVALEDETVGRRQGRDVDVGETAGLAEDDIGLAGIAAAIVAIFCPDDEVGKAVAIDVAGGRDAVARPVVQRIAQDPESLRGNQQGEVDIAEAAGFAENDVGRPGGGAAIGVEGRADDDVVDSRRH